MIYKATSLTAGDVITETDFILKDTGDNIWSADEKLYALRKVVRRLYPDLFVPAVDTTLTTDGTSYLYEIPSTMDIVMSIEGTVGTDPYQTLPFVLEPQGAKTYIRFTELYTASITLKIRGGVRLAIPTMTTTALDIPIEAEDLIVTGLQKELLSLVLHDKGKMNQFASREQEVTENDVQNMVQNLEREYTQRKGEIATMIITQVTRV